MTRTPRRAARLVVSLLAGLLLAGFAPGLAHAEDGYRFWGYYQWSGSQWTFSQQGADATVPADGSVEGWRYAVGGAKPRVPRAAGDFTAICGRTAAESGKKRVAVVVDSGTQADSASGETPPKPTGTCVLTDAKATGAKILAAIGPVRIEKGLTCGIDGYPAKGCGDPVKNIKLPATDEPVQLEIAPAVGVATPSTQPAAAEDDDGAPWGGIVIGAVIVLLLAGGGLVLARRRTS